MLSFFPKKNNEKTLYMGFFLLMKKQEIKMLSFFQAQTNEEKPCNMGIFLES